jgi:hypothetical protein
MLTLEVKITDSSYTHILAIVDRSGSMAMNYANVEMTRALNDYFTEQAKVEGKCLVDYVQFDTEYEKVFEDTDVEKANAVITPRGGTALLDAVGRGSVELGEKLAALPEVHRPGKVQVVIVTDGGENSSREWTYDRLKTLIETQTNKYDWDFVFLGANIDAPTVGAQFGINPNKAITFDIYNSQAVGATSASLSAYTTTYRGGGAASFSDEDRKAAVGS